VNLSVVICSHNARLDLLGRVLGALRAQTLPPAAWELVVVDDASREPLAPHLDLSWHPQARVVRNEVPEAESSLVDARVRGMRETSAPIMVFVDDDNVLAPDYLEKAVALGARFSVLGAWGGRIELEYEDPTRRLPPVLEGLLCYRNPATALWSNLTEHYDSTPWGAGLCIRRAVATAYLERLAREPDRRRLDPCGREMRFGGDTDLVDTGLMLDLGKGVFPELSLRHLIPPGRTELAYAKRAIEARGYSSALHGWINTGQVSPPRTDLRYRLRALWEWLRGNRWDRLSRSAFRRGVWRAYRELRGTSPRRI
jgi:glycosyltransferase involved in cell wall biosynthesis